MTSPQRETPPPPAAGISSSQAGVAGRLVGWRHPSILAAAGLSVASGFAQYAVTASLGDVAAAFGEATAAAPGASIAEQVGLSASTLGLGLGAIRLASLGSLPLSGLADAHGRRRVLLATCALGLMMSVSAAFAPSYWAFVAIVALSRPLLSATNAVAGVTAAEETRSGDRASAIAVITAAYGTGAGLTTLVRAVGGDAIGFRTLFALAVVPLLMLPLLQRVLVEPERFVRRERAAGGRLLLGPFRGRRRRRLAVVAGTTFAVAFVTGPVNTYLFLYAEGVLGLTRAATFLVVVAAAPTGFAGLLLGRWGADRVGRRFTALGAHAALALFGYITYSGTVPAVVGGYLLSIFAGSIYAPAAGALSTELFPTSIRATTAGWLTVSAVTGGVLGLVAFGMVADAADSFGVAAAAVALPAVMVAWAYLWLPETKGMELEDSAPESP